MLAVLAGWLLLGMGPMLASPAPAVAQSALSTGAILQGIIGYTVWPQGAHPVVLCLTRGGHESAEIPRQLLPPQGGQPLEVLMVEPDQRLPQRCNAAYLDGWTDEPLRMTLRALASQPVLTLGRGPAFCSDGGMFCLASEDGRTRFEVNLDAVARSGLRVHPQVLRLARPLTRPGG